MPGPATSAHATDGPDESVAASARGRPPAHARIRGATLDAAALYLEASRLTPADDPDRRLERARLAAECLFIDLSEIVQADRDPRGGDRATPRRARPARRR